MKRFARIEEDNVVEILEFESTPEFHPSIVLIEAPSWVDETSTYENGSFVAAPAKSVGIQQIKNERIKEVLDKLSSIIDAGIVFQSKTYQIGNNARADMGFVNQKFLAGETNPHGGFWRDASNNMNPLTDQEAKDLITAAFNYVFYFRKISWTHTDNINAMTRSEDVEAYDTDSLWND